MNVIVHFPQSPQDMQKLQKQAAVLYAQTVIEKITKLSCPTEQKIELLKEIEKAGRAKENQ